MKRLTSLMVLAALCAAPALAAAESFQNVPVVDVNCSKKAAADPDAHTRDCALKCAGSGFGIVTQDQKFLKFDAAGNAKITEALKASSQKDHLRVNVDGDVKGDTLKVKSVTLL
jgi:opacity protein-like surface antigen